MLHGIGRKQRSEDLAGMLQDCHARIRQFIALGIAVGERADAPDEEVVEACDRMRRYFVEAFPLHVRDEEESILPRLRGRSAEIDAALDRMHDEHALHDEPLRRVLDLVASVRADPRKTTDRAALARTSAELQADLERHLAAEEAIILPAVRKLLSAEEQQAAIDELRARRGGPPTSTT
jgi:iron-sulfur cluster repair protein YtfE (RIC family)